ncbi:prenyltransferase [Candidatus Bathyarchaeota archaeon]|nr:prenyltransferase [Candidatus Bathyarchaeota archaeon]
MSSSNAIKLLKIIRVHIVAGGVLAFSLGALLALASGGSFNPALVVSAYGVVLLGDLSSHYSNDYFDVEVDRHIKQKKIFAGSAILVNHPNLRSFSKAISIALLVCANVLALSIFLFLGAPIEIFIVIAGASLVGWFYSAPPLRLSSRGFGELAVACVTGFAIPGLGYLAVRGQFDPLFFYLAVPFVMYGLMLSLSLEAPDAEIDQKGGKRNFVVRKGERKVFLFILFLATSATLTFLTYKWLITSAVLDIGVLALFSIVPLTATFLGFTGVLQKQSVNRFSALNVASLFAFNMLTVAYLLTIMFQS